MKKQVIRVGDRVKIITSKFIKRVGYPLIWTDLIDEVRKDPRTLAAYKLLMDTPPKQTAAAITGHDLAWLLKHDDEADQIPFDLIRAVARMRVEQREFGGNERQLHYKKLRLAKAGLFWSSVTDDECADHTGQVFEVIGKKVVKTGIRFPAVGGQDSMGEYWEEPGGLEDCKTHVLLNTVAGWIEQVNVWLEYWRKPTLFKDQPSLR